MVTEFGTAVYRFAEKTYIRLTDTCACSCTRRLAASII